MTTVAFDGYTLASDSLLSGGAASIAVNTKKIFDLGDGVFIATCGPYAEGLKFLDWYRRGATQQDTERPDLTEGLALVVKGGKVISYDASLYPMPLSTPCAIGSGQEYALGAMLAGAEAVEAVRIACRVDNNSGGRVQSVEVRGR